jgi:hypothetical protein
MARRTASKPKELFLSHSSKDRRFVGRLETVFQRHRIPYWYGPSHIKAATQWHDEIGKALTRCDWFMVVLSPNSVHSKWVKRELLYALESGHYGERIVPVVYEHCKWKRLSWTLGSLQMVDFTSDFEQGCRSLLRIWRLTYGEGKASRARLRRR